MQDYIVVFHLPEAPDTSATMMIYRKASIAEAEAWVKSMFGTDIIVDQVLPRVDKRKREG